MKILFKIYTPYGDCYLVNDKGEITKNGNDFSGCWKIQGLSHVKMNWYIPFGNVTQELVKNLPLLYKNGNPQFTVRDLDHGTTREWGNTKYHGIKSISFQN